MYSRIFSPDDSASYFLFGPRGTGKSSWLRARYPEALYVDLLKDETFNALLSYPSRLEDWIEKSGKKRVVLDEVQKIPRILDEVHRLIEKLKIPFVLTGSSARRLKRADVNLLGGRAHTHFLFPLTAAELGKDFDLRHSLRFGHLPLAYTSSSPEKFLQSYVATYLKEEIQQEGLTRNLGAFSRFLESASFSQGALLNISEVARECAIDRKVAEQYFGILEDLLLAVRIPPFTKRAKRDVWKHPKFFLFDAGVYRTIRPRGPLDSPEEIDGAVLETLFLQEARALNAYDDLGYGFYYWRARDGSEVDFVLYGERGILAFEVKRASRVRASDLAGLEEFLADYPQAQGFCLYGGERSSKQGKISLIPYGKGIERLRDLLANPSR